MSRIRTIKPAFWSSATLGRVSRDARLTFIGLWNEADDFGRLLGSAKRLAGIVFPHDEDVTAATIEGWLGQLAFEGLILRYTVAGVAYIHVRGMNEHQKIDRRWPSQFPAPPDHTPQTASEVLAETPPVIGEEMASLTETPPIDRGGSPNDPRVSVSLSEKSGPEVGDRKSEIGDRKPEGEEGAPAAAPASPPKPKRQSKAERQTEADAAWEALMRMPYDGHYPPKDPATAPPAWKWLQGEFKAWDGEDGRPLLTVVMSKPRDYFKKKRPQDRWTTPMGVHVWLSEGYPKIRASYEQSKRFPSGGGSTRTPMRGAPTGEGFRKIPGYDQHGGRIDLPDGYRWGEADFHGFDQGYHWRDGKWHTKAPGEVAVAPRAEVPDADTAPSSDATHDPSGFAGVLAKLKTAAPPSRREAKARREVSPEAVAALYAAKVGHTADPREIHAMQIAARATPPRDPSEGTQTLKDGVADG